MRLLAMSTPVAAHPRRAEATARLPLPQATSSTRIPGRRGSRPMNSSATCMMVFATCPKSPDSQVSF
jgi:hypothetical protein